MVQARIDECHAAAQSAIYLTARIVFSVLSVPVFLSCSRLCLRTGLDPPSRTRPRLTGTQIYFFIGIALTLLHFVWHVQPILSSYHYGAGDSVADDPAYFALLCGMWIMSLCGIAGMGGFMYL